MGTTWLYKGYTRPIYGLNVLGLGVPESCDAPTDPYKFVTPLNTCWGLVGNKGIYSVYNSFIIVSLLPC